jgi:hypothetical protein
MKTELQERILLQENKLFADSEIQQLNGFADRWASLETLLGDAGLTTKDIASETIETIEAQIKEKTGNSAASLEWCLGSLGLNERYLGLEKAFKAVEKIPYCTNLTEPQKEVIREKHRRYIQNEQQQIAYDLAHSLVKDALRLKDLVYFDVDKFRSSSIIFTCNKAGDVIISERDLAEQLLRLK